MRMVRGRVLDIGCGAGRFALYLQGKGLDVTGIDLAPAPPSWRGVRKAMLRSGAEVGKFKPGSWFDTAHHGWAITSAFLADARKRSVS